MLLFSMDFHQSGAARVNLGGLTKSGARRFKNFGLLCCHTAGALRRLPLSGATLLAGGGERPSSSSAEIEQGCRDATSSRPFNEARAADSPSLCPNLPACRAYRKRAGGPSGADLSGFTRLSRNPEEDFFDCPRAAGCTDALNAPLDYAMARPGSAGAGREKVPRNKQKKNKQQ